MVIVQKQIKLELSEGDIACNTNEGIHSMIAEFCKNIRDFQQLNTIIAYGMLAAGFILSRECQFIKSKDMKKVTFVYTEYFDGNIIKDRTLNYFTGEENGN